MGKLSFFIVIISFLLISSCSKEENPIVQPSKGTIIGKVMDQTSGTAVSGVTITSQPVTDTVTTDSTGNFTITEIDAGSYILTAMKEGYSPSTENANVTPNQTTNINIELSADPPEPSTPEIYINLFQNKEIIDTAQIQINVIDTAQVQEVLFFVDDIPVLTFNEKNISFVWEVPESEDGSFHQIYCTAKNIYGKVDSTEIYNVLTYKLDTVAVRKITASEDSIFVEWDYSKNYYDFFHTSLTVKNGNNLVFSETKSVQEKSVVFKDSLNEDYIYSLSLTSGYKGQKAINFITKDFALLHTPKIDSLTAPGRLHPATATHIKVTVRVTSKDQLININKVNLYFYRPDSTFSVYSMTTPNLNQVTGYYTYWISTSPYNVPVLGYYRLEVEAIHKNGMKSKRLKKNIYLG